MYLVSVWHFKLLNAQLLPGFVRALVILKMQIIIVYIGVIIWCNIKYTSDTFYTKWTFIVTSDLL